MAIPATPTGFFCQTGNIQNYVSWDLISGATSYDVERSTDGVTYASVSTPTAPEYLDTSVTEGTQYWYKVASVNASGTSSYTTPQSVVPAPSGEMSLGFLRLASQQKADRVGSEFVTKPEWNFFIGLALYELYDLLITTYEDYYLAPQATFTTDGSSYLYTLPNGVATFQDANGADFVPDPIYKLRGVDLGVNNTTNNLNQGFVTISKFDFESRNQFVYPNSGGTLYGVSNLKYRMMGNKLQLIPTPSAGQIIRLWYIPRLTQLLKDTDLTTIGISGWLDYVIVRAAKYALDKEESDTTKLDGELTFLKTRIEASASNRDAGQPDTISDTRTGFDYWGTGSGAGSRGGY